jgi:hypothetical protein
MLKNNDWNETIDHLKELRRNYQKIFESDEGKQVLSDLEKRCHYWSTTNVKGDSHESAYMEGQRSVLLFIKSMLQKENKNVKRTDNGE